MHRRIITGLLLILILAHCGRTEESYPDESRDSAGTALGQSGGASTLTPPSSEPTIPPELRFPTPTVIPTLRPRTDLEKLLFQEGDVTYAKLSEEEDYMPEAFSEGKPPTIMTAMVNWTRGGDRSNDGFAWINVYEADTVDQAIPFFEEGMTPHQQIDGVGELAYRDETTTYGLTIPYVTFKRCNSVVIVSVPFHYSDININTDSVITYAQRIDARLQASPLCTNR
jgi:hypothetical protein